MGDNVRREALEEAAMVCDSAAARDKCPVKGGGMVWQAMTLAARRIRALAEVS
jgi:hypothetical protein